MTKLSKAEFLCKLNRAICQASLNRGGKLLEGYQIRDAIDRVGLPLPSFKDLDKADEELRQCHDPIFHAVDEFSDADAVQDETELTKASSLYPMMLAEVAWEHYERSVTQKLSRIR